MRAPLFVGAILLLVSAIGPLRADDQAEGRKVLDRAIQAMGGEAEVKKLATVQFKVRGQAKVGGMDLMLTLEGTQRNTDQMRMDVMVEVNNMPQQLLFVLNKDKAWIKTGERVNDLPKDAVLGIKQLFHALRLPQLAASAPADDYKLSPLGELQVGERILLGVASTHKEYKEVSTWFDKATGLPHKAEFAITGPNDMEIRFEIRYDEFKESGALKIPVKATLTFEEGKQSFTLEVVQFEPAQNVEDSTFAKPG